ncbi:hypothetical protein C0991_006874, partial [Blastosporella zonata]
HVTIVDEKVTEDWDTYKAKLSADSRPTSISSASSSRVSSPPSSSPFSFIDRTVSFLSSHSEDPLIRWARKHADDPFSASKRWVVERFQFGSSMFDPSGLKDRYSYLVGWQGGVWVNYWTQTVPGPKGDSDPTVEQEEVAENGDTINKDAVDTQAHSPVVPTPSPPIESPPAYTEKSDKDVEYFPIVDAVCSATSSQPPPLPPRKSAASITTTAPSLSLRSPPPLPPRSAPAQTAPTKTEIDTARKAERQAAKDLEKERKQAEKSLKKEQKQKQKEEKDKNKARPGRHFIVLPTGLGQVLGGGENWEKVLIAGVDDEVAAHCGLFIRDQNLDYEGFVERVGQKVLGWCGKI